MIRAGLEECQRVREFQAFHPRLLKQGAEEIFDQGEEYEPEIDATLTNYAISRVQKDQDWEGLGLRAAGFSSDEKIHCSLHSRSSLFLSWSYSVQARVDSG